jgi:long-chain fatty acid transport protein
MQTRQFAHLRALGLGILALLTGASASQAQGLVLTSVGPVNRSMGGASVAAPLDATGALYWNVATLSGLPGSELDGGLELLYARSRLSSAVAPGAFGPGTPTTPLAGSTNGDNGVFPMPSIAWSYRPDDSPLTLGFGAFAIGGFGVNYPADLGNPILSPRPPHGLGFGAINSELLIIEMAPAASYHITDHLAVGIGPTVCMAKLTLDPAFFASPDDANGDGFSTFPSATHARIHWGAGFQAGVYYTTDSQWGFGASLRSPQWFETFRFHATDEIGQPRTLKLRFDYPLIASIGASYSGFERLLLALDTRYVDYHNAKAFGPANFDATGAGTGLGWRSVFVVAAGAQYQLTECLFVRAGYSFNTNPIPDAVSSVNLESSPVYQHVAYLGASYRLTKDCTLSVSYLHTFDNSITGPVLTRQGPVPGTSVTNEIVTDGLTMGFSVRF